MQKIVIFDVGGVLRDSSLAMLEGYKRGFASIGLFLKATSIQIWHLRGLGKYNNGTLGAAALLAISRAGANLDEILNKDNAEDLMDLIVQQNVSDYDKKDVEQVYNIYRGFFNSEEARPMIRIFPDAKDSLTKLIENGYKIAIFSNAGKASLLRDLPELSPETFSAIVSEEDVQKKKPSGEGITKILQITGIDPTSAYYVGDAPTDIIAAKDAKVRSIALTTGMGLPQVLAKEMPELIFNSLTEMTNYLVENKNKI